jgi:hypothetical protein
MVMPWMEDEDNTNWACGIQFIAHKNRYHEGIKQIPYVLRYGQPCRVGLSLMNLPPALLQKLVTEEGLEEAMKQTKVLVANLNSTIGVQPQNRSASTAAATAEDAPTIPTTAAIVSSAPATTEPAPAAPANTAPSDTSTTANSDNAATTEPAPAAPANTAPSDTITTANSDNAAVEAGTTIIPAASMAERKKTILEEVVRNQQASQAEHMKNAVIVSTV